MYGCAKTLNHIYEYLNANDLPPGMMSQIGGHLRICRECSDRFEFERRLLARIRAADSPICPETLKKRVQKLLQKF